MCVCVCQVVSNYAIELWLGWLQDELPLVTVPEASVELRQLFERATADYLCM